ncbi:hypothetical protein ABZ935_30470 [Streptomyces coeruleorubidus]|uniref:TRADD-N-associated membrane domain-containing protein n=1 Tax=Streptomyces coeruleorubidus TaxID=116188 RepID=UPI0033C63A47
MPGTAWRQSPEYEEWTRTALGSTKNLLRASMALIWFAAIAMTLVFWAEVNSWERLALRAGAVGLVLAALIVGAVATFSYMAARRAFYERMRCEKSAAIEGDLLALRNEPRRLELADLFVINRRQLDEYHITSLHEQRLAFRNAQIAAAVGFLLLVSGVVLIVTEDGDSARYAIAGLTGLASLLSGFISAVFFKSYADTTEELRHYYWEPLRTGQILAAERLAELQIGNQVPGVDQELRKVLVSKIVDQLPQIPTSNRPSRKSRKSSNAQKDKESGK